MSGGSRGTRHAAVWLLAAALPVLAGARFALAADLAAARQKARACSACHGPHGSSTNPMVPSLAGQPRQFIVTQLFMFREGRRKDPQMSPVAAGLTNTDFEDLAAYFSAQAPAATGRKTRAATAVAGRKLAERHHCIACHGARLMGQQHIPRLAGQQAEYLRMQLRGFKASTRFDMDGVMTSAAQALSDADIDLLAEYLAGLE